MMDDLISRKAAIDALGVGAELLRHVLDDADIVGAERAKYEWGLGLIESYVSDIEELPSAQPFYNITVTDVLKYIDGMPEDVWLEFTECLRCRGWELQWRGGDFA